MDHVAVAWLTQPSQYSPSSQAPTCSFSLARESFRLDQRVELLEGQLVNKHALNLHGNNRPGQGCRDKRQGGGGGRCALVENMSVCVCESVCMCVCERVCCDGAAGCCHWSTTPVNAAAEKHVVLHTPMVPHTSLLLASYRKNSGLCPAHTQS